MNSAIPSHLKKRRGFGSTFYLFFKLKYCFFLHPSESFKRKNKAKNILTVAVKVKWHLHQNLRLQLNQMIKFHLKPVTVVSRLPSVCSDAVMHQEQIYGCCIPHSETGLWWFSWKQTREILKAEQRIQLFSTIYWESWLCRQFLFWCCSGADVWVGGRGDISLFGVW